MELFCVHEKYIFYLIFFCASRAYSEWYIVVYTNPLQHRFYKGKSHKNPFAMTKNVTNRKLDAKQAFRLQRIWTVLSIENIDKTENRSIFSAREAPLEKMI